MNKEQYLKKQQASIAHASQVKKETDEKVANAVDEFFIEQKEKRENYVPQKLIPKQLPVGLYIIRFEDGVGIIPTILSGTYTSIHQAEKAIALYIAGKQVHNSGNSPNATANTD